MREVFSICRHIPWDLIHVQYRTSSLSSVSRPSPLFSASCLLWGVRSIVLGRVWPRNHQSMLSEILFVSHPCMVQCSPAGPRRSSYLGDTQASRLLVSMLACYVWCLGREVGAGCTKQHKELRLARGMRFDRCNFRRCSPDVVALWL